MMFDAMGDAVNQVVAGKPFFLFVKRPGKRKKRLSETHEKPEIIALFGGAENAEHFRAERKERKNSAIE